MRLVELACANAREEAERVSTEAMSAPVRRLELLGSMLKLEQLAPAAWNPMIFPTLGSDDIVASMVVFADGQPLEKGL